MKLSIDTKIILSVILLTITVIIGAIMLMPVKKSAGSQPEIRSDSLILGAQDAKVTVVEFSNFECIACKSIDPTVEKMLKTYDGKVRFVFKHFPFDTAEGNNAFIAAEAAEAAAAQGKFMEMKKLLFENQGKLTKDTLKNLAKNLNLDTGKFNQELDNGTYKTKVEADKKEALSLGITSTPTFYINGELYKGRDLIIDVGKALNNTK